MSRVVTDPSATDALDLLDRDDLLKVAKSLLSNGVALSFHGKRTAMEISKQVRPRVTRREPKLHVGPSDQQTRNLLIEGENLQAMVTLYKYRGAVDLILTDPPYNTGNNFRYNDRWDEDPNDPNLGTIVAKEDGSRHTKWIKAIYPRLQMMKSMLRPSGVIAICIDDNELFHLGMMMDEIFGEKNRLGIINWQKSAAPRPDNNHVSSSTEYVLVYSRDKDLAVTASLARTGADNRRYGHWDKDPNGLWREGNLTAKTYSAGADYAIQSPFTGEVHYPAGNGSWRHPKRNIKTWLAMWGAEYEERSIRDGRSEKALMIVGAEPNILPDGVRRKALERLAEPHWPFVWFGHDGGGRPRVKTYLERIKRGKVPVSYWASEEFAEVTETGSSSWDYEESGRSSDGVSELTAIVGDGHGFTTVKPLKLMEKIIEIWCPPGGLVLDPYAGSGTTGHAVLNTNAQTGADRRFILIEQGEPTNGDKYARSLTWKRLRNAITGDRPGNGKTDALGGGFEYRLLTKTIDARALMAMKRDELVDVVLTSHWETHKRNAPGVQRLEGDYQYLIGQDAEGEAYFLIWDNDGPVGALDLDSYKIVATEAKKAGLKPPFHVYARYEDFQSPNVRFWKIPDRILAHLGLDENESYNDVEGSA